MDANDALEKLLDGTQNTQDIPLWTFRYLAQRDDLTSKAQVALALVDDAFTVTALAANKCLCDEAALVLLDHKDEIVNKNIATNSGISQFVALEVAKKGYVPSGFIKGKSLDEIYDLRGLFSIFPFAVGMLDWLVSPEFIHAVDKSDPKIAILAELGFANSFGIEKARIWKYQDLFLEAYSISTFYY